MTYDHDEDLHQIIANLGMNFYMAGHPDYHDVQISEDALRLYLYQYVIKKQTARFRHVTAQELKLLRLDAKRYEDALNELAQAGYLGVFTNADGDPVDMTKIRITFRKESKTETAT